MLVAAVQLNASNDMQRNWKKIRQFVQQACARKVQLVLLPEVCMAIGQRYQQSVHFTYAEITEKFSQLAKEQGVCIVVGSIKKPIDGKLKSLANTVVFSETGQIICEYQKIHLFDANIDDSVAQYRESDDYEFGKQSKVFNYSGVNVGLSICYDLRFSELFRVLRCKQAELIVVPAAFTFKTGCAHWMTLLKARAIEFGVYILAANQTGWHDQSRQSFGHSCLIDPWGKELAILPTQEGVIAGRIDVPYLNSIRQSLPSFSHRREFE